MGKKYKSKDFVQFAYSKIGTPYVYGMRGKKMTSEDYDRLKAQYGKLVWDSDKDKIGQVCCDCSGLMEWFMGVSLSSSGWYDIASKREPISKAKDMPVGALLWHKGHIGLISKIEGNDVYYIACDGSAYGCREANIKQANFTHVLLVDKYFEYEMEDDEVVEKGEIIYNDKSYEVDMIRKDDITYLKSRDMAKVFGIEVDYKGKTPIFTEKK